MPERDPLMQALIEGLALVSQLGLLVIASFGIAFGAGWALDRWLGTDAFKWIGLAFGVAALYWSGARLLRKYWRSDGE